MTAQAPDVLFYLGERLFLFTNPLDHMPGRAAFVSQNSANWRGYIALWEIVDDRLYLKDIHGAICRAPTDPDAPRAKCGALHNGVCQLREATVAELSPRGESPLFADWFSGELKSPQGDRTRYVHMGYGSEYERYRVLTVVDGVFKGERTVAGGAPEQDRLRIPRLIRGFAQMLRKRPR